MEVYLILIENNYKLTESSFNLDIYFSSIKWYFHSNLLNTHHIINCTGVIRFLMKVKHFHYTLMSVIKEWDGAVGEWTDLGSHAKSKYSPLGGGKGFGTRITIDFSSPASNWPMGSSSSMLRGYRDGQQTVVCSLRKLNGLKASQTHRRPSASGATYLRSRKCIFLGVELIFSWAWDSVSCEASSSLISSMMSPRRMPALSARPLGVTCKDHKDVDWNRERCDVDADTENVSESEIVAAPFTFSRWKSSKNRTVRVSRRNWMDICVLWV